MNNKPRLLVALIPVVFLIIALSINVIGVFGDDALSGSNQFILLLAAALAAGIGMMRGIVFKDILAGIERSISSTAGAILIILCIGALAGSWMISGVVPAMVYYGLQLLSPSTFLPTTAIICALVSLATGSSWGTSATVGIALIGVGDAMGISQAMVAGSVISGAYFGDKISPLSDTTNLAPAMAGTDLFTHIRYMLYTTLPSFILALIIFFILNFNFEINQSVQDIQPILTELETGFNLTPWLFLAPALVIFLIIKKMPAVSAILIGALAGGILALIFQRDLLLQLGGVEYLDWQTSYRLIMNSFTVDSVIPASHPVLTDLLQSGGMASMMGTVWLVLAAMTFGGVMDACGFLEAISNALLSLAKGTASLIATTAGTCVTLNITASDQYLAIVVPGKMFADAYKKQGLAPENLSRTLEDSGTVTSVLVPWNTCGAYQSGVLGVDTLSYAPYAFFNFISPLMTIIYAVFNIKIRRLAGLEKS